MAGLSSEPETAMPAAPTVTTWLATGPILVQGGGMAPGRNPRTIAIIQDLMNANTSITQ